MTTQAAETDLIVSDPTGRPSFLPVSIVPVVVAPPKRARRKHRATGKPRSGRRMLGIWTVAAPSCPEAVAPGWNSSFAGFGLGVAY